MVKGKQIPIVTHREMEGHEELKGVEGVMLPHECQLDIFELKLIIFLIDMIRSS